MTIRSFIVEINVAVDVCVPNTDDIDDDREEAALIAQTLLNKRISLCTWGIGNPWTAEVRGGTVGYPEHQPCNDDDEDE